MDLKKQELLLTQCVQHVLTKNCPGVVNAGKQDVEALCAQKMSQ